MHYFPAITIDNFFSNPNDIICYANDLSYNNESYYPGERSDNISDLDPEFASRFAKQFLGAFYESEIKYKLNCFFQRITPYQDDRLNEGWIHSDADTTIGGIVYLNKNSNIGSGTSIYYPKDSYIASVDNNQLIKKRFYAGEDVDIEEYISQRNKHNLCFEESVRFNNKFNRLVSYDAGLYHKANGFGEGTDEPRLTFVFFFHQIHAPNNPINRGKK
jgi:hypothetical protein